MASRKPEPAPRPDALFGPLFEQFPVGLAIFNMDGRFLHANAVLARMLGYTVEELLQRNHLEVVHADDREAAALLRVLRLRRTAKPGLQRGRHAGLEPRDVDTDVVIGKARWEINGLAPMQESWEQHKARLRRMESFSDFVLLRYKTSGELRYLSVSGEPLFDEHGRLRGYHGIGKD